MESIQKKPRQLAELLGWNRPRPPAHPNGGGEGRRPGGPSAFASVRLPRSRHRSVSAPLRSGPASASSAGALSARSLHCAEPYARRRLPRSFLARRRPGWGEKAVAASRPFEIDRSLRRFGTARAPAPSPLRPRSVQAPLRFGPAPFRPRLRKLRRSPHCAEPSLRGAFTARSLCCAGAFARRAFAPPLAPNRNLPHSRLPSLRGAVTAVTEGCCRCLCLLLFVTSSIPGILPSRGPAPLTVTKKLLRSSLARRSHRLWL